MTAAPSQTPEAAGLYLLMKRGLYYRPDAMGYTGIKDHAGRYTKDEAESHADPASGVTMIAEAEAEDFAPNCYDDLARNHLQEKLASAQAVIDAEKTRADRLAKALEQIEGYEWPVIVGHDVQTSIGQATGAVYENKFPIAKETALSAFNQVKTIARAALQQETQP